MAIRLLGALSFTALFACAASAATAPFSIDSDHTHVVWQVDRFGFTKTIGTFTDVSGVLLLDEAAPQNSRITATIALAGLRSDHAERERIVRGPHWLDAVSHPAIHFASTAVARSSECPQNCYRVTGEMTMRGATAPLALEVRLNKLGTDPVTRKRAAGFTATGSFSREAFGVTTALGPIGADVDFQIEALAIAETE
ncbi:MAG: YceI family protein [Pseudomonadota bacterium]